MPTRICVFCFSQIEIRVDWSRGEYGCKANIIWLNAGKISLTRIWGLLAFVLWWRIPCGARSLWACVVTCVFNYINKRDPKEFSSASYVSFYSNRRYSSGELVKSRSVMPADVIVCACYNDAIRLCFRNY